MSGSKLIDYEYLIFDVYGTLVDWETGLYNALQPLLRRFRSSSKWSRKEALQAFGSVEMDTQAQNPTMLYSDLLAKCHEVLESRLAAADNKSIDPPADPPSKSSDAATTSTAPTAASNEHVAFGQQIKEWDPFPDSANALKELSKFYKLIVLSNVDRRSFAYTHSYLSEGTSPASGTADQTPSSVYIRPDPNPDPNDLWLPQKVDGTKSPFSLIMTAQDTGAYKPSLIGFNAVLEAICADPTLSDPSAAPTVDEVKARTLVVAQSLKHDHVPAQQLGIKSVWIDRSAATMRPDSGDGKEYGWTWKFPTLGDMAKEVQKECTGSA